MDNDLEFQDSGFDEVDESPKKPKKVSPIWPIVRTLQRKAWLVSGVTGTLAVLAWMSGASTPPLYQGGFRLLVEPVTSEARIAEPTTLSRTDGGVPNENIFKLDYPTQLEILRSPRVLDDVYEAVVAEFPDFSYGELFSGIVIARSGGKSRTTETRILDVTYQGYNPDQVDLVLQELAKKYLRYSLEDRKTRISEGVKFIEDQLPGLQARVDALQGELQELQQTYDLLDPASQAQQIVGQLNDVANQQLAAQRELQETRQVYTLLQNQLRLTPEEAIAVSALSQNPRYQQILGSLSEIDSQMALESVRFTAESPALQRLQQKRDNLAGLAAEQGQQILGTSVGVDPNSQLGLVQDGVRQGMIQQLVSANNELQVLEVRSRFLSQTRLQFEQQVQQFPLISKRFNELQRQLGIATRTLDQLLSQRESLRVAAAQTQVPWEVVSEPRLPRMPDGTPISIPMDSGKKLIVAVVAGFVLSAGAALLIERIQDRFFGPKDVDDLTPEPLLATIPRCRQEDPSRGFWVQSLLGRASEQELHPEILKVQDVFNGLFANLRFLPEQSQVRSLVVSSADAGDGKTTVALNLAETAAGTGQRVLLVDANLRSPQLHSHLGLPNLKGFSDVLRGDAVAGIAQAIPGAENLHVLTTGDCKPGTTRLLASPHLRQTLDALHQSYDLVIYDTPGMQQAIDSSFLAACADGMLLVVGIRHTSRARAKATMRQIEEYGLTVVGAIANLDRQKIAKPRDHWNRSDGENVFDPVMNEVLYPQPSGSFADVPGMTISVEPNSVS